MEHRVAAWESMPWEAGGRGGCRAWRKDGRHERTLLLEVPLRLHLLLEVPLRNRQKGFPPLVESRPVTGPQPLYQPQGVP